MLISDIERLIKEAAGAKEKALAPYSGFSVGAALLADSMKIYRGCNIENPSLMMSFCAERTAFLNALTNGEKAFRAMAIVSGDGKYCFPCGACRQMIYEFAPEIGIYIASDSGIKKYLIAELLPHPYQKAAGQP